MSDEIGRLSLADAVDREFGLEDLLPEADRIRVDAALRVLVAADARVRGTGEGAGQAAHALLGDSLHPLGSLEGGAQSEKLEAGAVLVNLLLKHARRYHMAADLHLAAIQADYAELQRKHAALEASEARYRELAAQLERRVEAQVATIDQTRRQLYHADKLAAVGQLAAGVAHEINNPIGFIRSNLSTAKRYLQHLQEHVINQDMSGLFSDFNDLLTESIDGADRVARIVATLKDFSGIDQDGEDDVDLNQLLRGACELMAPSLSGRVEFVCELEPLPAFRCSGAQFSQVFHNLLRNAVQAIDDDGRVSLMSRCHDGWIEVRVADDGCGIAPAILPRVFEAFYTTREVGQGTGLGLTLCYDVVTAHQGTIAIESELGVGTAVTLRLPLSRG